MVTPFSILKAQSITMDMHRTSPAASVSQRVGVTDLKVEYHRPYTKGRIVWGGLIPYNGGKPFPWRAGANDNTVFETTSDILVEGKELAKGRYGIHMIATENEVEIIFSNNSTSWGSFSYTPKEDALRVKSDVVAISPAQEQLTYQFLSPDFENAQLEMLWGDKKVVIDISVNSKEIVFEHVRNQIRNTAGFTWLGLHEAAQFTLSNEVHMDQGFKWISSSVRANPNQRNIMLYATLDAKVNKAEMNEDEAIIESLDQLFKNQPQPLSWLEYNAAASHCLRKGVMEEKGIEFAEMSIKRNKTVQNQLNKALLLDATNKSEEASELKNKVFEEATNAQLNAYGYTLLYGGKPKESLEIFEVNAKNNPKDPNVFDSLGEAYFRNGKQEEAKNAFKQSLSLNPPANVKANTLNFLTQMGIDPDKL